MVQWQILNNSHAYPFCKTTPGTTSYLVLAIAPFLSVKLAEICRGTIQSVKVRVHLFNPHSHQKFVFYYCCHGEKVTTWSS